VFDAELQYFKDHQEDLVKRFKGTVLVIRGREVVGAFPTALEAFMSASTQYPAGSYMLQPCEPGSGAYTVTVAMSSAPALTN
jgi:hypothetical protein